MTLRNQERAVLRLTGMVSGLFTAIQVLVKAHPDPNALLSEINVAEQIGLAQLESAPIDDAAIEGHQHVFDALRKILKARVEDLDNPT